MATDSKDKYYEGIGRRKSAVARVRITPSSKSSISINDKTLAEYFKTDELQNTAEEAFGKAGDKKFVTTVKVEGGGLNSQAESVRLGVARALIQLDADLRGDLKKAGYLKRDPRKIERKKPGLKKARKRAQWSKR